MQQFFCWIKIQKIRKGTESRKETQKELKRKGTEKKERLREKKKWKNGKE